MSPVSIRVASWARQIAPWPLRPVVSFFVVWYFYVATATGQLLGRENVAPSDWIRSVVVDATPAAIILALIILAGRQWQKRRGIHLPAYFVTLVAAASVALMVRLVIGAVPLSTLDTPVPIIVGVFRIVALLTITLAIAGALTARLQRQVEATQRALDQVEEQQALMLAADESARRQVAALLHDRVQAGLIASGLELQMLMNTSPESDRAAIRQIVSRLEELRTLDVRRAARALSPDLHDVDLQTALEDLAAQYEPAMGTVVHVTPELDSRRSEFGDDIVLAVYRVVEQALMNAAQHGRAQHAHVSVDLDGSLVAIAVSDDGRGAPPSPPQGLGSAVLTTWTRLFDGEWSLVNAATGGAVVRVTLQVPT